MSTSRKPWLRLVAFCVGLHIACTPVLADEIPLFNCLEQPQPADASQLRAMAASVGSSSDIGNLTVIEFGGEYDRDLAEPRQLVAQRFYQDHPDDYDFLIVFTTFEFETAGAHAFYNGIRNDTDGLGLPVYDNSAGFGSNGRLQGYVDMAALSRNSFLTQDPRFQFTLQIIGHELMHRWGSHLQFRDVNGNPSADLIGPDQSHWSYFLDTDASIMYGNDWRTREDGGHESVAVRQRFSPLDLYSAGLFAASEVLPFGLIRGGTGNPTDLPKLGAISAGSIETVTIEQVIAESGPRSPTAAHAQKDFRAAFILLKRPGEQVGATTTLALEQLRTRAQQYFSQITLSRANLRIFTTRNQVEAPGLPQILIGSGASATPPGIASAITWLEARQHPDGHWQDHESTALRDTIAAVQALQELHPQFTGLPAARGWIALQTPVNLDDAARRWLLNATLGDGTAIEQAQTESGWSISPKWQSSSYDTALVADANSVNSASPTLAPTLASLTSFQRVDGAFAHVANGRGRIATTARAAAALAGTTDPLFSAARGRAVEWLDQRLLEYDGSSIDGLFTLPDFVELYIRAGRVPISGIGAETVRQRVRTTQQIAGDWSGSVYLTATAALARARDQRGNLTILELPTATPESPADGQRVVLSATMINSGNAPIPSTVLRWYNSDPDLGGVQIGTDLALPGLSAGARASISTNWNTTGQAGARHLWLVADATDLVAETSEDDNRAELVVVVQPPSPLPDLTIEKSDVHFNPASVTSLPSPVQMSATVRNIGLQSASSALVRLSAFRSGKRTILAEVRVDVSAQSQAQVELMFTATTAEALQLVLDIDPENKIAEGSEANNSVALVLPFGPSLDLEVTDTDLGIDAGSPSIVGSDMRLAVQLHNRGTVDSPVAQVQAEIVQGATRYPLTVTPVQVPAGQTITRILTWRPSTPGNAQLQVFVDPLDQLVETREDNNSAQFDFTVADATQPDLTIISSSVAFTPETALQGQPLTATLNVRNLGQDLHQPFTVGFYATDPRLGAAPLVEVQIAAGLGAGVEVPVMLHVADWPMSGDANVFFVVDAGAFIEESDEENNRVVKPLRSLALPDLAVSLAGITLTPALPVSGEPVQAQVTVRNLGAQGATSFKVKLFEGESATGTQVPSEQTVPALAAGGSVDLEWNWTLGLAEIARQVTVVVDDEAAVREGGTDNNIAMLPFDVQDTSFFASERYISPNGDGIKDATAVVIRLEQNEPVTMRVLNGAQSVVRDFGPVSIDGTLRGQVIWDGRDDRGRIASDGDYRVTAFSASQQVLGSAIVTVDNNRSSVLEAINTRHAVDGFLPSLADMKQFPQASPLFGQVWGLGLGIYRADTVFRTPEPIISQAWIRARENDHGLSRITIQSSALGPNGLTIAFIMSETGGTAPGSAIWTIDADKVDTPYRVPLKLSTIGGGSEFAFLDSSHIVLAGGNESGQLISVDLVSGGTQLLRETTPGYIREVEVIPDGVLVTNSPGDLTFYSFDSSRSGVLIDPGSEEPYLETEYELAPNKRSIAIHVRSEVREAVEFLNFASGARDVLVELESTVFTDPRAIYSRVQPTLLEFGWLKLENVLLVLDGRTRQLKTFNTLGELVHDQQFGSLVRDGNYASTPQSVIVGAVAVPLGNNWNFPTGNYSLLSEECALFRHHLSFGAERQSFDPTNGRVYLSLGEYAISLTYGEGVELDQRNGIVDDHSIPLFGNDDRIEFSGSSLAFELPSDSAHFPTVPACPDHHAADWPHLFFADGARIRQDGRIQTLSGGVSTNPWPYSHQIEEIWPDDSVLLLDKNRVVTSLLNGSAVLKAQNLGRGIQLYGVAADRNFAYYEIDWAPIDQPDQWNVLSTVNSDEVLMDEFLVWVPPQPGTFTIRLRVVDKAGNATSVTTTASSFAVSPIESFGITPRYLSPNGDSIQDEAVAKFRVRQPTTLDFRIEDVSGRVVRADDVTYGASEMGPHEYHWDGRDEAGADVPDGRYRLKVAGFAVWLVVDSTAPDIAGELIQAYQKRCLQINGHEDCRVLVAPTVRYAVDEINLDILRVESAFPGTNDWIDASGLLKKNELDNRPISDQSTWLDRVIQLQNFAGRRVRLVVADRAGNRRSLALGDAEQGLWLQAESNLRIAAVNAIPKFQFQPPPFENVSSTSSFLPIPEFKQGEPHWLVAADGVLGLTHVSVETSTEEDPEQWTERGTYPIEYQIDFGIVVDAAGMRSINLPIDTILLENNRNYLVRLRGARSDGTTVLSNIGKIRIATPHVSPPGDDDGTNPSQTGYISFYPVLRDQCDGIPSGQIGLSYSAGGSGFRAVRISYVDGRTLLRVSALERGIDEGSIRNEQGELIDRGSIRIPIDGWPEGRYEAFIEADFGNGYIPLETELFTVETTPPVVSIFRPLANEHICTFETLTPRPLTPTTAIDVGFDVESAGNVGYRIELGQGQIPVDWTCFGSGGEHGYLPGNFAMIEADEYPLGTGCHYFETQRIALHGSSIHADAELLYSEPGFQAFNGLTSLRLKATNWSGGSVCTRTTVRLDSIVDLSERSSPTQRLFDRDSYREVGIGPSDNAGFGTATFRLRADEELDLRAEVHRAQFRFGQLVLEDEVRGVIENLTGVSGNVDINWDGRINGSMVDDGLYGVRVSATDGCGHEKSMQYLVHVDASPPIVQITTPLPGEQISLGVVEISGITDDPLLANWTVDVASSALPGSWDRLAQGSDASPIPRVLAQWQRGNAVGPARIRLRASDLLGNTNESIVDIVFSSTDTARLIETASFKPLLFSPNGDQVLDLTQVTVGLLAPTQVSLEVAGRVLFNGMTPGSLTLDWDGRNAMGTTVADGRYFASIHAIDPLNVLPPETVVLTVSVDSTPPEITIVYPTRIDVNADNGVQLRFDDVHLTGYSASLTRVADGAIVASTQGTQSRTVDLIPLSEQQEGDYLLSANARDGAGNRSEGTLQFTLDKTAPVVDLITPLEGAVLPASSTASVRGSVNDDRLASYSLAVAPEGIDVWTELSTGTTAFSDAEILAWHPNLPDGHYRLRLRGTDLAGNNTEVIHAIVIDATPPLALITAPLEGGFVRSALDVEGTATDTNFAEYRLSIAPAAQPDQWSLLHIGTSAVEAATLAQLTVALSDGDYFLRLIVSDKTGQTNSDQVRVRLRTSPPPAPLSLVGHAIENRDALLEWQPVNHPELAGYTLYRGGTRINAEPISLNHFTDINVPEGSAQYWVRAVDLAGNESLPSNTVSLLFDRTPPLVQLFRPSDGERVRGVVSIVGTAYSRNDFKEYRLSAAPINPPGSAIELRRSPLAVESALLFDWSTIGMAEDAQVRLLLEGEDQNGNIATASVSVVIDNLPPAAPTGLAATLVGVDAQIGWNPNSESDLLGYLLYRDGQLVNVSGDPPADLRAAALTDISYLDRAVPNGQHVYVVHAIDRDAPLIDQVELTVAAQQEVARHGPCAA